MNPTSIGPTLDELRSALGLAVRAPSIHNTQPWRWVLTSEALELHADRSRQLRAIDPDARSLLISCGGAQYLAVLGLAAAGWSTTVDRLPDPAQPDLLARLRITGHTPASPQILDLAAAADRRHTERRPFKPDIVSAGLLDGLTKSVAASGVYAHAVERPDERLDLAVVVSWADRLEGENDAYRAELTRWVGREPGADEGIPASVIPHVAQGDQRHADVPLRNFEVAKPGGQAIPAGVDEHPVYVVLFTQDDDDEARLRVGEAYVQISVEAELRGLASSAATQAVDLPGVRERLRMLMAWIDHPQMILRVGWPPEGPPPASTPRRSVDVVLTVVDPPPGNG